MRKLLCVVAALCVPWSTPGAQADELTPRYRHIIGVSLGWTGAKEYSCPDANNTLTTYRPANAQVRGVRVLKVFPGSPAEKSGLACGDVIFSVNGIDVDSLKIEIFIEICFPCPNKTVGLMKIRNIKSLFILSVSL